MSFNEKLEFGEVQEPYYAIKLTTAQAAIIGQRKVDFFKINGRVMFPIRENGVETGEYVIFVTFTL